MEFIPTSVRVLDIGGLLYYYIVTGAACEGQWTVRVPGRRQSWYVALDKYIYKTKTMCNRKWRKDESVVVVIHHHNHHHHYYQNKEARS